MVQQSYNLVILFLLFEKKKQLIKIQVILLIFGEV